VNQMTKPDAVLACLYDRPEGFFALDELSGETGLDSARLGAVLDELGAGGHELEMSPAHGVRLIRPVRLSAHLVGRGLAARRVGRDVICFDEVSSTSDVAWDSAARGEADGLVVLAEFQRSGRGRQGSRWVSPPGKNVLMSVVLADHEGELAHDALTIASGLAVAEGIESATGLQCHLKWPNDVLLEGGKVAGVLVELHSCAGGRTVVVGVGINANAAPDSGEVSAPAACLAHHAAGDLERVELVRAVIERLDEWVRRICLGRLEDLHERWLARCDMINQRISVSCGQQTYVGRALDVSPLEGMILCCDDGHRVHLPAESSTVVQ